MIPEIMRPFRLRKLLGLRKILYLPHILNPFEKKLFLFLIILVLVSGGGFLIRTYLKFTEPIPDVGGTYVEGMLREPGNLNPIYASTDADRDITRLIFSRLISYSGSGELQNDLAENLKISEDGKIYEISLKKNVRWHDGKNLNADDIIFTVKTIQNPQYKSPLRQNWQGVSAEKIDDHTVKFSLKTPYAPFVENLALGIIPKHLWEGVGPEQMLIHKLNLEPIGSGPYVFDEFKQDKDNTIKRYVLKKSQNYYQEGPYIKNIEFLFFKNEEELLSSWRKGAVDGFGPFPATKLAEVNPKKTSVKTISMPRIFGLFFNNQPSSILSDKTVSRAIALSIDKEKVISLVSSGGAVLNDSPLPSGAFGYTGEVPKYTFDPETASEILEAAGWGNLDGDGIREKKKTENRKEVKQTLKFKLATSDWPDLVKIAEYLKDALAELKVGVELEIKNFAELDTSVIRPRNFDMLLFGQVYGYEPDPFAFWHSSQIRDPGLNIAMYNNKKVDTLLEESRRTIDTVEREEKLKKIQQMISEDIPAVFLYSQLYLYLLPTDVKGANISTISLPADRFNEINKWYIKTKRVLR